MPELQPLSSEEALAVVKEAESLATEEQDVSFYAKATSARFVFQFAGLLLLACILGFGLYLGFGLALGELHIGRRGTGGLMIAVLIGAYHLLVRIYRWRTPQRMRPYVLKVLEKRKGSKLN